MFEYLFFDNEIRDRFCHELSKLGAEHRLNKDSPLLVEVPEDIDEALSDVIDTLYEKLLQATADLLEEQGQGLEKNVAGVQVQLADGGICTIRLEPDLVSRLLTAISMEELRDMCQVIAEGVERRDNSPLCHDLPGCQA